jgi:adenosine deaminase CECR1
MTDENGTKLSKEEIVELLMNLVEEFKKDHPKFMGMKVILTMGRDSNPQQIEAKMQAFERLNKKFPSFVVGFDVVGQEDVGKSLKNHIEKLKEISRNGEFFFHAGETNWYNTESDDNVIDAILMNTTRIGHGYSVFKHPVLWAEIKRRNIAIEVNPISNQVLHLVQDLRNHPASFYISENIPIVISNDDPGFWNSKALSYDFYYAFMAFTPADAGLRILKQLALNSIEYSSMSQTEKAVASEMFNEAWMKFIEEILLMAKTVA